MKVRPFEVGDRVRVSIEHLGLKDALGTVFYIDKIDLFNSQFKPIQVELDEPFEESHGQRMVRMSLKELKHVEEKEKES